LRKLDLTKKKKTPRHPHIIFKMIEKSHRKRKKILEDETEKNKFLKRKKNK
jgi:hypothetical protein